MRARTTHREKGSRGERKWQSESGKKRRKRELQREIGSERANTKNRER